MSAMASRLVEIVPLDDLAERFRAAWRFEMDTVERISGDESDEAEKRWDAAIEATSVVVDEIEKLADTTMAVIGLKALAFIWCGHDVPGSETMDGRLSGAVRSAIMEA